MISGKQYEILDLLTKLHAALDHTFLLMQTGKAHEIEQAYLDRFYRLNCEVNYTIYGEKLRAKITGIGEYGMLQLRGEDGRKFSCGLKEVIFKI